MHHIFYGCHITLFSDVIWFWWYEPEPKVRVIKTMVGRACLRSKEQQVLLGSNTSLFRFYKLFGFFALGIHYLCVIFYLNNKIVIRQE